MTTYTTITNALVAVGAKPFATTIQALRDNPIAIGEADATVPAGLLPTVHLGTIATTSGSTVTLSGLVLTPYRFLAFSINAVSFNSANVLRLNGASLGSTASAGGNVTGGGYIDLANGVFWSSTDVAQGAASGLTNASTSISFTVSGSIFDAGSIRIYGVK